jgi:hypothetical protein
MRTRTLLMRARSKLEAVEICVEIDMQSLPQTTRIGTIEGQNANMRAPRITHYGCKKALQEQLLTIK